MGQIMSGERERDVPLIVCALRKWSPAKADGRNKRRKRRAFSAFGVSGGQTRRHHALSPALRSSSPLSTIFFSTYPTSFHADFALGESRTRERRFVAAIAIQRLFFLRSASVIDHRSKDRQQSENMVISAKELITYTWRSLVLMIVHICSSAYEHPILAGMFFFVILLYIYLPYLFSLLVFFSPVITCTGLLLGVLLSYGQPAIPGMEDATDDGTITEKDAEFSPKHYIKHRPKVDTSSSKELKSSHYVFHASRIALLSESNEEQDTRQGQITNAELLEEDSIEAQESWGLIDHHDASESDSDHAESSSPDASMTDILPMLYELHPLIDSEDPQPLNPSATDVHSASGTSMEESESEEEVENTEEGLDEETEEKNGDEAELAVRWTEDDEKNVMVLGTSELERNQRLENLIAKRKARKNTFEAERNLIDLDGGEPISSTNGLSHFQAQIHPISVARHNPFDLPYDSEEAFELHPIPGSAPSVLLPRQNPFDSPRGAVVEGSNFSGFSGNNQGFASFHQREMFIRRHESFAHVAPYASDVRFKPYFVSERVSSEETSYAHLQRQLSDKSDSKESSSHGSESASSDKNEPPEEKLNQETEFGLDFESKTSEVEKSSSDEADSVDSKALEPSTNETFDQVMEVEDETPHDIDASPHISDVRESPDHILETVEDSSGNSTHSLKSVSMETEIENDVEPVYDLSPSALGKFRAQVASFGEEFIHVATESLKATSSLPMQTTVSSIETGEPSNLSPLEENVIDAELPEDKDEYEYIEKTMSCSSSASLESDSTESIEQDAGVNQQSTTADEHPSNGSSTVEDSHLEQMSKSLPAIGEDSQENSEQKHEHEAVPSSGVNIEKNESEKEDMPVEAVHEDIKTAGDQALLSELDSVGDFRAEEHQRDDQRNEKFNQGVNARHFPNVSASIKRNDDHRVLEPSSSVEVDHSDGNTTHSVEFKSTSSSMIKEKDESHESDSSSTSSSSDSD